MPFTISHAAAAWPMRTIMPHLPLVPLVVGTLSPDFEYFYRLAPTGRTFHNPAGIVLFCLPVSLVVVHVFDHLVRPYAASLFPRSHSLATGVARPSLLAMAAAILLGAASHVVWDAFTHGGEWGAVLVPALLGPAHLPGGFTLRWHQVLQHTSTAVGLVAIGAWVVRRYRQREAAWRDAFRADLRSAAPTLVAIAAVAVACALANSTVGGFVRPYAAVTRGAVGGMVGLVVAAMVPAIRRAWAAGRLVD